MSSPEPPSAADAASGPASPASPEASDASGTGREHADVHVVAVEGREFVVVGTAHVSRESADLVRSVIERERPDCVCIELDAQRFQALSEERRWEDLDLREVIRRKQLATLMGNVILMSYQRQIGMKLGVMPGTELLEAARVADELGVPVALCDRDVRVTLRRAWRAMPWYRKLTALAALMGAVVERPDISEEDLRELRQQDVVTSLMTELGEAFPSLKRVLIDERDTYLTQKMRESRGDRVVAVVGAGHVEGIRRALARGADADLVALDEVPPVSPAWKWVGWGIPALIVGGIVAIGVRHGVGEAGESALFWIAANGVPAAIGAVLARAHPATVVAAGLSAPWTSLTPVVGVGYVTAFVQAWVCPPLVREFQELGDDVPVMRKWWSNRLLRIFLVLLFTTIGSLIGTWVGGAEILASLVDGP